MLSYIPAVVPPRVSDFLHLSESGIAAFIPLYQDLTLSLSQHVILEILLKAEHSQLATR
ncbi:hypothetical protein APH_0946 [Anaplasma phagocytophilum str. HZ]|uniref:Uncharacterized protein n=1 Tax=Anaplasma phagocytophilum (strain HZ) TaxID=212042 RepID=Q2GJD5_ANAPZ|nr:hypothetical protein APH_0946 [Anaplasma phagocytophilum str. HZ]